MSASSEASSTHSELVSIIDQATAGLGEPSAPGRSQYHFLLLMALRRLESIYVRRELGFIAPELPRAFERPLLSTIWSGAGGEWWPNAKPAFSERFVTCIDERLATKSLPAIHPGFDASENSPGQSSQPQVCVNETSPNKLFESDTATPRR